MGSISHCKERTLESEDLFDNLQVSRVRGMSVMDGSAQHFRHARRLSFRYTVAGLSILPEPR
jgi:hypothetical protein